MNTSYLGVHLHHELVEHFVPVLLMPCHLIQQILDHFVELLQGGIKLAAADFASQGNLVSFLAREKNEREERGRSSTGSRARKRCAFLFHSLMWNHKKLCLPTKETLPSPTVRTRVLQAMAVSFVLAIILHPFPLIGSFLTEADTALVFQKSL